MAGQWLGLGMKRKGSEQATRRTGRWLVAFRAEYLTAHPLCERCEKRGRFTLATEVDHRTAIINGGEDFDIDPGQAQGLCAPCHKAKTIEDLGQQAKVQPHSSWS